MAKKKSLYSVQEAVAMAWDQMPNIFYTYNLILMVRALLARPSCHDGTILRKLRVLREEHPEKYDYKVISKESSQYQKLAS